MRESSRESKGFVIDAPSLRVVSEGERHRHAVLYIFRDHAQPCSEGSSETVVAEIPAKDDLTEEQIEMITTAAWQVTEQVLSELRIHIPRDFRLGIFQPVDIDKPDSRAVGVSFMRKEELPGFERTQTLG